MSFIAEEPQLKKRVASTPERLTISVLCSIALHVVVLLLLPIAQPPIDSKSRALQVWLSERPGEQVDEKKLEKKRLVTIKRAENDTKPKDAGFLASTDSSVDTQTRAKNDGQKAPPKASNNRGGNNTKKGSRHEVRPGSKAKTLVTPKGSAGSNDPFGFKRGLDSYAAAGAKVRDHLPDIADGDVTRLNAWRWRHAPFFNRIKSSIGNIWSPGRQIQRHDPKGALLGQRNRVTVLQATIDRQGQLKSLFITDTSGVAYLDEEAQRAIKQAAPFLFPPKELFGDAEQFVFTFAFHLEIDRGFRFDFAWDR